MKKLFMGILSKGQCNSTQSANEEMSEEKKKKKRLNSSPSSLSPSIFYEKKKKKTYPLYNASGPSNITVLRRQSNEDV